MCVVSKRSVCRDIGGLYCLGAQAGRTKTAMFDAWGCSCWFRVESGEAVIPVTAVRTHFACGQPARCTAVRLLPRTCIRCTLHCRCHPSPLSVGRRAGEGGERRNKHSGANQRKAAAAAGVRMIPRGEWRVVRRAGARATTGSTCVDGLRRCLGAMLRLSWEGAVAEGAVALAVDRVQYS
jgi:hypothetical protein